MRAREPSEASSRVPAGNRLGKYRLVATLGRGGMADVYLAMLEGPAGFSKLLVVKELRDESHEDDIGVQMFLDEARVAARLNHPNIVQTLEVGSDEGRCFLAMEYLDGQSLRRVIHRASAANTPLPLQTHLRILVDVLSALDYAHSLREFDGTPLGIVHRDVSPQNVILTYEGHVKLIDFGIAKTVLASAETREGIVKGKVKYMPPEQATGQPVDARTDVFAVGVLLWEALAGRGPWHGESDVAIFRSLMSGVVPRLSHVRPGLHPDLVAIVDRAVSAAPRDRYPTAAAMRDELESRIVASHGPPATLRDLPTLLCTLFERERRELRIQIDAWIRRPESVPPAPLPISLTRVRTETTEATRTPTISKLATQPKVYVSPIPPGPGVNPRLKSRVAVAAAAVTVVAAAAVLYSRWPTARVATSAALEPRPATWSPPPSSAPSNAGAGTAPSSHVEVRASPSWARLYVDDAVVSNPYVTDTPRGGTTHVVRAEAPGYLTKTGSFSSSSDGALNLPLERVIQRPTNAPRGAVDPAPRSEPWSETGSSAASVAASPPAPSHGGSALSPARRPKREVDKEDPYAQ